MHPPKFYVPYAALVLVTGCSSSDESAQLGIGDDEARAVVEQFLRADTARMLDSAAALMFAVDSEGNPFCELGTDHLVVITGARTESAGRSGDTVVVRIEYGQLGRLTTPSTAGPGSWRFTPSVERVVDVARVVPDSTGTPRIVCRDLVPNHTSVSAVTGLYLTRLDTVSRRMWDQVVRVAPPPE
ncbi:MAG: hypothetical protein GTO22_21365 [Gemmatimonadales bacterium]|nr:hypothetical protein [Gemmatimonadales bacterium]